MTMNGFDMIFRAIGIDPNAFIEAIKEVQQMAYSIAQKTAATDAKMERIEYKLDLLLSTLDVKDPAVADAKPLSRAQLGLTGPQVTETET